MHYTTNYSSPNTGHHAGHFPFLHIPLYPPHFHFLFVFFLPFHSILFPSPPLCCYPSCRCIESRQGKDSSHTTRSPRIMGSDFRNYQVDESSTHAAPHSAPTHYALPSKSKTGPYRHRTCTHPGSRQVSSPTRHTGPLSKPHLTPQVTT